MPRYTIRVEDNVVVRDGVPRDVDCSGLSGIHAVQWSGKEGHVEYTTIGGHREPNKTIRNLNGFEDVLSEWDRIDSEERDRKAAQKTAFEKEEAEREKTHKETLRKNTSHAIELEQQHNKKIKEGKDETERLHVEGRTKKTEIEREVQRFEREGAKRKALGEAHNKRLAAEALKAEETSAAAKLLGGKK